MESHIVVLTILINISQWEGLSHILWKNKSHVPKHQPVDVWKSSSGKSMLSLKPGTGTPAGWLCLFGFPIAIHDLRGSFEVTMTGWWF
jgi:hypothetical protein